MSEVSTTSLPHFTHLFILTHTLTMTSVTLHLDLSPDTTQITLKQVNNNWDVEFQTTTETFTKKIPSPHPNKPHIVKLKVLQYLTARFKTVNEDELFKENKFKHPEVRVNFSGDFANLARKMDQ